ncbi:hypothetical protein TNCV_4742341 [Trichonephila clavipes]|nr:hypothetical protein TNCV_4742341 [Trichonephila clavipes]
MTLKHHRMCLKLLPLACMHSRHGLADMFKNTRHFMDCSIINGYSFHQVHFRMDGRVINRGSESVHVLKHPSERLTIRSTPRWIFPYNRTATPISVG